MGTLFSIGNIIGGLSWGAAAVFLFAPESMPHQFLLAVFVTGISCGAAATYWPITSAYLPTILAEMAPLSARFIYEGDDVHVIIGVVILMFAFVLIVLARHTDVLNTKSLKLGFEKSELIDSLEAARSDLENRVVERTTELALVNEMLNAEIEERKKIEAALRESEQRYRAIFNSAGVGIDVVDRRGRFLDVNSTLLDMLGYDFDSLRNLTIEQVTHEEDLGLSGESFKALVSGDIDFYRLEKRYVRKDGSVLWGDLAVSAIRNPEGKEDLTIGVIVDVTERKRAAQLLRDSEERYRTLFESAKDAILILEGDTFIDCNDKASELFDCPKELILGRTPGNFSPETQPSGSQSQLMAEDCIETALAEGKQTFEWTHSKYDGSEFFAEVSLSPMEVMGRKFLIAIVRDITQRKLVQRRIEWDLKVNGALAALYRPLISSDSAIKDITDTVLSLACRLTGSRHGYVAQVNAKGDKLVIMSYAPTPCEGAANPVHLCLSKDTGGRYPGLWGHVLNTGTPFFVNSVSDHPSSFGAPDWHTEIKRFLAVPVLIGKELVGQIALANPETPYSERELEGVTRLGEFFALGIQRKRIEEELRHSEDRFRILSDGAFEGILISHDGNILDCNRRFSEMSGYGISELQSMKIEDLVAPELRGAARAELSAGSGATRESAFLRKDGARILVDVSGKTIPYRGISAQITSVRDVTLLKRAQELQERLATVVEQAAEAIVITDTSGAIQHVNPAFERVTGYSMNEALGRNSRILKSGAA